MAQRFLPPHGLPPVPVPVVQHSLPSSIPPTPDEDAAAPYPDHALSHSPAGPPINDIFSLLDASLPPPVPLPPAAHEPLLTPSFEQQPSLDLAFAGSVLPSTNVSLPTSTVVKAAHNLRLPSFDQLGIAVPHPDRPFQQTNPSFVSLGAGPLSKPEDPLHALSPPLGHPQLVNLSSPFSSPKAARAQVGYVIPSYTPPSEPELGTISWGSLVNPRGVGLGSPPSSDPARSPNLSTDTGNTPAQAPIIVPTHAEVSDAFRMATWIEQVKGILTSESCCSELESVKILSHALPCPSLTGHLFGQIIAAIHDDTTTHTSWINVFHAVPGRYTLSDLPKSPPSTPGPAVGGDSYFTSKVFDSAVAIPDYQLDSKLLPPSPQPVVPPGSINISVVERYIPPTNTNEYAEMFSLRGRSLLYDRLVELSPNNGTLLFVYLTKKGAQTFRGQYLGPVIDPLLRTVTVVHDLHSELGRNLASMDAMNYLDDYDRLEDRMRKFCSALSERQSSTSEAATYEVIHAAREERILERKAWADDWWIKQEKPRLREIILKYFRKSKKLPTDEMSGAHLLQEILEGVSNREYIGEDTRKGVEVGVFVVRKTGAA